MNQARIKKVRNTLSSHGVDALIVESPINLRYLTGMDLSAGILLITATAARLVVDARYYEVCKREAPVPVVLAKEGAIEKLLLNSGWDHICVLGFDSCSTTYERTLHLRRVFNSGKVERRVRLKPLKNPVSAARIVKDSEEASLLKRAAKLCCEGVSFLCCSLREGVTEVDLVSALDIFWKQKGGNGFSFDPIIAFGTHGSMPHYRPTSAKLKRGMAVLMDIGVNYCDYHSDMTRVVSFGPPSDKLAEIHAIVLKAQLAALARCTPGTPLAEIDVAAREVITAHGYGKEFSHSLGHGIGLEVHEQPFFRKGDKTILQPGMAITIEPGIYLPDVGGVRIEDTILITSDAHENLTASVSKELEVVG